MKLSSSILIIVTFTMILSGCKKDEPSPTTPAPTGACNTLTLGGTAVPETAGPGTQEIGTGGTIIDGTYFLTTWYIYPPGSIDPFMRTETWKFSGGTVEVLAQKDSNPVVRASGTYIVSGNDITINVTCPSAQVLTGKYTATPTQFKAIEVSPSSNEVHIYVKQ